MRHIHMYACMSLLESPLAVESLLGSVRVCHKHRVQAGVTKNIASGRQQPRPHSMLPNETKKCARLHGELVKLPVRPDQKHTFFC